MGRILLLAGIGGFIGGMLRYLIHLLTGRMFTIAFPIDTLLINIAGCFLIGIFYAWSDKADWITAEWKFFLLTGLCGGFTTFSAFSLDSFEMLKQGEYLYLTLYISLSLVLGIGATFGGIVVMR